MMMLSCSQNICLYEYTEKKKKRGVSRYIFLVRVWCYMDYIDDRQKCSLLFFPILRVYMRIHMDIELVEKKEQEINQYFLSFLILIR
jgi:hypothetical protein